MGNKTIKLRAAAMLAAILFGLCLESAVFAAADGSCIGLLSDREMRTENQFASFLKNLFEEGVITEQELIVFRDALVRGERINPIENPDLDIARYVAFEKIQIFLDQNLEGISTAVLVDSIIRESQKTAQQVDIVTEDVTGIMFKVKAADQSELKDLILNYFSKPESAKDLLALNIVVERIDSDGASLLVQFVFSQNHWSNHPELLKIVIEKMLSTNAYKLAQSIFANDKWSNHPELLRMAIDKTPSSFMHYYLNYVFSQHHWENHPELLRFTLAKIPTVYMSSVGRIFSDGNWLSHPELLRMAIEKTPKRYMQDFIEHTFSQPYWSNHPELLRLVIERTSINENYFYNKCVFSQEKWALQVELREAIEIVEKERAQFLREKLGPYSWDGTEQENLEEYLNKRYGRIDE